MLLTKFEMFNFCLKLCLAKGEGNSSKNRVCKYVINIAVPCLFYLFFFKKLDFVSAFFFSKFIDVSTQCILFGQKRPNKKLILNLYGQLIQLHYFYMTIFIWPLHSFVSKPLQAAIELSCVYHFW